MCHQYETSDDLQMTLTAGELLNTSTDWPRVCSRSSATTLFFQSSIRSCRGVTSMSVIALDNAQQKRVNTYFLMSLHAADMSPSVRYIRQITCRLGTCESFFFRSNQIFKSNRPVLRQQLFTLYTYSEYLIHLYFVFVTNESDARTTELRTEYLFISIQS